MANYNKRTAAEREHMSKALTRIWQERYAGLRPLPHWHILDKPAVTLRGLRKHRLACGFSQPSLALHIGVSITTIQDLERGMPTRNTELVEYLATALRTTATSLESGKIDSTTI